MSQDRTPPPIDDVFVLTVGEVREEVVGRAGTVALGKALSLEHEGTTVAVRVDGRVKMYFSRGNLDGFLWASHPKAT